MRDAGRGVLGAVGSEGVSPPDPATNTLERATVSALLVPVLSCATKAPALPYYYWIL